MLCGQFVFLLLNAYRHVFVKVRIVVKGPFGVSDLLSLDEILLGPHGPVERTVRLVDTLGLAYLKVLEARGFRAFLGRALYLVVFRTLVYGN